MKADTIISQSSSQRRKCEQHGMRNTPEYAAWGAMLNRCFNSNTDSYPQYGGRGITVCQEWRDSFVAFYKCVGDRPEGYSLERIDVNGNYEPGNVKWAPAEEQCNNRTNAVTLTYKGKTQTIAQWARELGLKHQMIRQRVLRGWTDPVEILETPCSDGSSYKGKYVPKEVVYNGESRRIKDWIKVLKLENDRHLIKDRIRAGWPPERAFFEPKVCYNMNNQKSEEPTKCH